MASSGLLQLNLEDFLVAVNLANDIRRQILTGSLRYEPRLQWNQELKPLLGMFTPGHYTTIFPNSEADINLIKPRALLPITTIMY